MFKERVVSTIKVIVFFGLLICVNYRIRSAISRNCYRPFTKWLFIPIRYPRSVYRVVIVCATVLLGYSVSTIIVDRCRSLHQSSFANASTSRVCGDVFWDCSVQVMSFLCESLWPRVRRNDFVLYFRIDRRPRSFIDASNRYRRYGHDEWWISFRRCSAVIVSLVGYPRPPDFSEVGDAWQVSELVRHYELLSGLVSPLDSSRLPSGTRPVGSPFSFDAKLPRLPPIVSLMSEGRANVSPLNGT